MKYRRGVKKESKASKNFLFGITFNAATFFILVFIASVILSKVKDPLGASGLVSPLTLIVSAAISGFFTARRKGDGRILPAVICALCFSLILFAIALIFCSGKVTAICAINLLCYVAVAFIFAMLSRKRKKHRR